jgi:hypothetical protein
MEEMNTGKLLFLELVCQQPTGENQYNSSYGCQQQQAGG